MGDTLLSYPDRTRESAANLTGGSWQAGLPLANLKDRLISKVARSANALAASTQFTVDLGQARDVKVLAALGHNLTLAGTIRVRAYSDAGLTTLVYDSGTVNAWPVSFGTEEFAAAPKNWILPLSSVATARYWKWELVDTANPAGYLQLGRAWMGPAFQPDYGIVYDGDTVYESRSTVTESRGGTPWPDIQESRRVTTVALPYLTNEERRTAFFLQKTLGIHGELVFVENQKDAAEDMLFNAYPCRMRSVSPIRRAGFRQSELPLDLVENL